MIASSHPGNQILLLALIARLLELDNKTLNPYNALPELACIHCAKIGSINICFSGLPNATTVSLCIYNHRVWKPKKSDAKLKCEIIASLCSSMRAKTLFSFCTGS